MGKKSGPTPPPPPDPVKTAQAQAQANIETAREQQRLNLINTYGPQGSVVYAADPNAPGGYRQTTALSPEEQAIYGASKGVELGAVNVAGDQLGRVRTALETPLDTRGLPRLVGSVPTGRAGVIGDQGFGGWSAGPGGFKERMGVGQGQPPPGSLGYTMAQAQGGVGIPSSGGIQSTFDKGPALQYEFDKGQQVQGQVGGNQDLARLIASDANYRQSESRLDPRFGREQRALEQKLANQGLGVNSTAYQSAMQQFSQGKNDAYDQAQLSAIREGEAAAQGQFGRQLSQGQFANQAAAQMYGQNLGASDFFNRAAGQQYGQNLGAAQLNNQAQQQGFAQELARYQADQSSQNQQFNQGLANAGLSNAARQQGLQERAYVQNQPINQLTGLLGLGQVGMPQGVSYSPTQVGQTDVLGAYALNQQAQNAQYQAQMQNRSGLMGGLFQLGSAAIMASDGRLKTDKRLLRVRPDGIEVWAFRYITDEPEVVRVGVMAQQLKKIRPDLVVKGADGFLAVNYAALEAA